MVWLSGAAGGAAPQPVTADEVTELLRRQPNGTMSFQVRMGWKRLGVAACGVWIRGCNMGTWAGQGSTGAARRPFPSGSLLGLPTARTVARLVPP